MNSLPARGLGWCYVVFRQGNAELVMRIIHLLLSSLPGKDSSDLLVYKEPGEFGSLLSDHPVANDVAEVHKHLNTFRMLRGCEQCDS